MVSKMAGSSTCLVIRSEVLVRAVPLPAEVRNPKLVAKPRSESMYGVGNLTHTAYANQRMTLCLKIGKI